MDKLQGKIYSASVLKGRHFERNAMEPKNLLY